MQRTRTGTPARSGKERASADGRRFLLVERPAIPWNDAAEEWAATDRAEYERARRPEQAILLLDGGTGRASIRAPALLRESLLSMWNEAAEDETVRRELTRLALEQPQALSD